MYLLFKKSNETEITEPNDCDKQHLLHERITGVSSFKVVYAKQKH